MQRKREAEEEQEEPVIDKKSVLEASRRAHLDATAKRMKIQKELEEAIKLESLTSQVSGMASRNLLVEQLVQQLIAEHPEVEEAAKTLCVPYFNKGKGEYSPDWDIEVFGISFIHSKFIPTTIQTGNAKDKTLVRHPRTDKFLYVTRKADKPKFAKIAALLVALEKFDFYRKLTEFRVIR